MSELVIGRGAPPADVLKDRKFQNARYFTGVREGVKKAFVEHGEDEIIEAYKAEKIQVEVFGGPKGKAAAAKPPAPTGGPV